MRARLLELPRGDRGRREDPFLRCGDPPVDYRVVQTVRGSSIRQSERLLTVRLWVRVPPPELQAPPLTAALRPTGHSVAEHGPPANGRRAARVLARTA